MRILNLKSDFKTSKFGNFTMFYTYYGRFTTFDPAYKYVFDSHQKGFHSPNLVTQFDFSLDSFAIFSETRTSKQWYLCLLLLLGFVELLQTFSGNVDSDFDRFARWKNDFMASINDVRHIFLFCF